jgi:hypothetical protein
MPRVSRPPVAACVAPSGGRAAGSRRCKRPRLATHACRQRSHARRPAHAPHKRRRRSYAPPGCHDGLVEGLLLEGRLRLRIAELQAHRAAGRRTLAEVRRMPAQRLPGGEGGGAVLRSARLALIALGARTGAPDHSTPHVPRPSMAGAHTARRQRVTLVTGGGGGGCGERGQEESQGEGAARSGAVWHEHRTGAAGGALLAGLLDATRLLCACCCTQRWCSWRASRAPPPPARTHTPHTSVPPHPPPHTSVRRCHTPRHPPRHAPRHPPRPPGRVVRCWRRRHARRLPLHRERALGVPAAARPGPRHQQPARCAQACVAPTCARARVCVCRRLGGCMCVSVRSVQRRRASVRLSLAATAQLPLTPPCARRRLTLLRAAGRCGVAERA